MSTKEDIAWLAGIIDGEGCFTIKVTKTPSRKNTLDISPFFTMELLDGSWVKKTIRILKENDITYGLYYRLTYKSKRKTARVHVVSRDSLNRLCKLIRKDVTVKKLIVEHFIKFPKKERKLFIDNRWYHRITAINWDYIKKLCKFVEMARKINDRKNKEVIWDTKRILSFYENINKEIHVSI